MGAFLNVRIWLGILILASTWATAHAEPMSLDLPPLPHADKLRFRAVIDHATQDEIFFSEDGGSHWRSAFKGHIRELQLPVTSQDAPFAWIFSHRFLLMGQNLSLSYANEELNPHAWHLTLKTSEGLAIVTPWRVYRLPSMGSNLKVRLLDEAPDHTWQVLAIKGTVEDVTTAGVFLFTDGQSPVQLSGKFSTTPIRLTIFDARVEFEDADIAHRLRLTPFTLSGEGLAKLKVERRAWDIVDQLIGATFSIDQEKEEALFAEVLDSQILRTHYVGRENFKTNEALIVTAKSLLRERLYKIEPRLSYVARNAASEAQFESLLTLLANTWVQGTLKLEPLLAMVKARLQGRSTSRLPTCESDLVGFKPPLVADLSYAEMMLIDLARLFR